MKQQPFPFIHTGMLQDRLMLFSGSSNIELAKKIGNHLNVKLGVAEVKRFSDGEISVDIKQNVRGRDIFIIQPTSSPCNDHIMELILMTDALRRSSAGRITAVVPYYGYSRQDRRPRSARVPISAKVVANLLEVSGINRILTMDLHADQIQGFFDIPVDNIYASKVFIDHIIAQGFKKAILVSPDVGGVIRARAIAKFLGWDIAIIDKRRSKPNEAEAINLIGDVEGRVCVMVDDIVDTAGTLCKASDLLKSRGAKEVWSYCTHPVLSGGAINLVNNSSMDGLVVSDTIALPASPVSKKVHQLSVAVLIAEAIKRINTDQSVSSLFD